MRAEEVIAEVDAQRGRPCCSCEVALLGQEVVVALLMGLAGERRCARCLAAELRQEPLGLLRRAAACVRRLDCYRAGWQHADRLLAAEGRWPEERLPAELRMDAEPEDEAPAPAPENGAADDLPEPALTYDAGDTGCGDLVLELRLELAKLSPGDLLLVRATDPGAPRDLPAWARLTGHALVRHEHPLYWFRRRDD